MIVTIYHKDGRKERQPQGYAGGQCHVATAPYEKREVKGSVVKTPTGDACKEPEVAVTSNIKAKRT